MIALSFEAIAKSYAEVVALRDVSFEVHGGEVFGLLGPNGAGKTTLIRILMDIIRADRGRVVLFGEPHRRENLDRVGYLPEERGLYRKHKVREVMTYFGVLKGLTGSEARRRVREWLDRIEMPEVSEWRVERLSKGMGQKIQIASALLPDPDVCVLDEPFSGLDPVNVRWVRTLIANRKSSGRTTILSTHQMNMVEELCDRVVLIDRGEVIVYGPIERVRRQYSRREVRVELDGPLPDLPGVENATPEDVSTWRLALADGVIDQDVLAALVHAGTTVVRFERALAPMDEVFIRAVQQERR
jgi:ABC-2 type transport system ATP-binding protein